MSKTTQWQRIVSYMRNHGSITSWEAIQHLGCTRLSGRIYEIKKMGYNIQKDMVDVPTRYGNTRIAVYRLEE